MLGPTCVFWANLNLTSFSLDPYLNFFSNDRRAHINNITIRDSTFTRTNRGVRVKIQACPACAILPRVTVRVCASKTLCR